jgi:cell division protein FtsQ
LVEKYFIFKRYPSTLDINIEKTKFLAKINKNGQIFYLGSNGKLIKNDFLNNQLPYIFGNPDVIDFFKIKEIIDKSKISYSEIKNLYFFPSKRWDIELRNNTIIKLPNKDTNLVLNQVIEFLYNDRYKDNKIIDARVKNQIILDD